MRPAQIPGCCREAAGAGPDRQPTTWRPSGAGAPRAVVFSRVMATPTAGGLTVLDDDAALRILVARALGARKHARSLRTFPLCAPLPGQARLFERCVRQAERRLVLPARITLEWRAAGRDHEHGVTQATFDAGG